RRLQVANTRRERRECVQRITELVERERLYVKLQVGALALGVGAGEQSKLGGRHGERTAPAQRIIEPHADPTFPGMIDLAQALDTADFVNEAELQMVL